MGLSFAGDTDFLIFAAETQTSFSATTDFAVQHSHLYAVDNIVNFDLAGNSAAESISFDVFRFDFSNLADSVANNEGYISKGVLIGEAADYLVDPASNINDLPTAVARVEGFLGSTLTMGEVFAFYWSGSWYVGVGAQTSGNAKLGTVVKFVGLPDVDEIQTVSRDGHNYFKLYDDTAG